MISRQKAVAFLSSNALALKKKRVYNYTLFFTGKFYKVIYFCGFLPCFR